MKKLKGRYVTDAGTVVFDESGVETLISEQNLNDSVLIERTYETSLFNDQLKKYSNFEINFYNSDDEKPIDCGWNTPEPFKSMDLEGYIFGLSKSPEQDERIAIELSMFNDRNLYPLLRHLIFLVDYFRKNNVLWGVGRGSSVNSYVLYLIGIHKVDSLKYQLDINDFLK